MDPRAALPQIEAEVRRIGALQLQASRALAASQVRLKSAAGDEDSWVTDIDLESEQMLHAFVRRSFPSHSFLGEETGHDRHDPDHYWIVDPIDGTTNLTHGMPYWGPSVAYWQRNEPILALVYFPALGWLFKAARGAGATLDDTPIHTSPAPAYTPLTAVALHSRTHYTHHLRLRTKVRVLGSLIANMCLTARGTFVAMHGRGRLWDLAAGILILREAGAIVDSQPDWHQIMPADYGADGRPGPLFTLFARANGALPPLADFLSPQAPD